LAANGKVRYLIASKLVDGPSCSAQCRRRHGSFC
jgi:hypothetical protein